MKKKWVGKYNAHNSSKLSIFSIFYRGCKLPKSLHKIFSGAKLRLFC